MLKTNRNINCLYIGSKFPTAPDETQKLREKMTKKERLLYSRYRDISDDPITEAVDENKVKAMFGFYYKRVDTLLITQETPTSKKRILDKIDKLFAERREGTVIIFSGNSLRNGSWLVEEPDKRNPDDFSVCYEDIHDMWAKSTRHSGQKHLLIIIDANFSGHWCRRRMLKPNKTISIQTNGRYWDKSTDDKRNGSFFLHNLFKVVKQRQKEVIVEPYINQNQPYFWGDFVLVAKTFGLMLNYICWQDMRQALGVSKYGYWPREGANVTGLNDNGDGDKGVPAIADEEKEVKLKKRDGFGIACRNDGIIEYEGNWKQNQKHGFGIEYDDVGLRKFEGSFLEDKKVGKGKEFFTNGQVKYEAEFKEDVMIGEFKEFYDDGVKKFDGEFVKAFNDNNEFMEDFSEPDTDSEYEEQLDFPYQDLLQEGNEFNSKKKMSKGKSPNVSDINPLNVTVINTKNRVFGIETEDKKLNKSAFGVVNKKKRIVRVGAAYYPSGIKKAEGRFINGIVHGKARVFHPNGACHFDGMFRKGVIQGNGKEYWDNKTLKYEGEFVDGVYYGEGRLYHRTGVLLCEGTFIEGKLHGMGTTYYLNGNIMYEGEFQDGKALGVGLVNYNDGDIDYIGKDEHVLKEAFVSHVYGERREKREFEAGKVFPIKDEDLNRSFDAHQTKNFDMDYKPTGKEKLDLANKFRIRKEMTGDYNSVMYSMNKEVNFAPHKIKPDNFFTVEKELLDKSYQQATLSERSRVIKLELDKRKPKKKETELEYLKNNQKSPLNDKSYRESYLIDKKRRSQIKVNKKDQSINLNNPAADLQRGPSRDRANTMKLNDNLNLSDIQAEDGERDLGETFQLPGNIAPQFAPVGKNNNPIEIDDGAEKEGTVDSVVDLSNASNRSIPDPDVKHSFDSVPKNNPFAQKQGYNTNDLSRTFTNNPNDVYHTTPDTENPVHKPTLKDDVDRLQNEDLELVDRLLHLEKQVEKTMASNKNAIKQNLYKNRRMNYTKPREFKYRKPAPLKTKSYREPQKVSVIAQKDKHRGERIKKEPALKKKSIGAKMITVTERDRQVKKYAF